MTEDKIVKLREKVKSYLKENRYSHVFAVEKEAAILGEIYLPSEVNRLRVSALLHDITKKNTYSDQLKLCEEFKVEKNEYLEENEQTIHQLTGALVSKKDFGEIVDDEILSGIRWHTTGHANMNMFEDIIFLADYIEETRTWPDCIELRKFFYENLDKTKTQEDKIKVLYMTMIKAFDLTIANLKKDNLKINSNTIKARDYFSLLLKKGMA